MVQGTVTCSDATSGSGTSSAVSSVSALACAFASSSGDSALIPASGTVAEVEQRIVNLEQAAAASPLCLESCSDACGEYRESCSYGPWRRPPQRSERGDAGPFDKPCGLRALVSVDALALRFERVSLNEMDEMPVVDWSEWGRQWRSIASRDKKHMKKEGEPLRNRMACKAKCFGVDRELRLLMPCIQPAVPIAPEGRGVVSTSWRICRFADDYDDNGCNKMRS